MTAPDDLVVTVPEDVRERLILCGRHTERAGSRRDAHSTAFLASLAVARAVAEARGIPHAGQQATS